MRYSSVETFFFAIPPGPVTIRLTILQEGFQHGNRHPHWWPLAASPRPPQQTCSYLVFWALDLTGIFKVWLTNAGRITP